MKDRSIEHTAIIPLLADIFEAGFDDNRRRLELLAMTVIRSLRKEAPEAASAIAALLSSKGTAFHSARGVQLEAAPVDQDSSAPLVRVEKAQMAPKPIFNESSEEQFSRFINEWTKREALLSEGFMPPCSLLLKGPPGTGKTMFAKWLAGELKLAFVTLDLASSISSYLGKTGMNLRRALDYARARPCLLLLDEFDAVAKRRDDATEVGELKRIVNVLLKELEDWPTHSLLIAATNHPELLDPAISRRFDRVFTTSHPEVNERMAIMMSSLGRFVTDLKPEMLKAICEMLAGKSGSDLHTLSTAAVRRHIIEGEAVDAALIAEMRPLLAKESAKSKTLGIVIRGLRYAAGDSITIRDIARLTGIAPSTVHYHLQKG